MKYVVERKVTYTYTYYVEAPSAAEACRDAAERGDIYADETSASDTRPRATKVAEFPFGAGDTGGLKSGSFRS